MINGPAEAGCHSRDPAIVTGLVTTMFPTFGMTTPVLLEHARVRRVLEERLCDEPSRERISFQLWRSGHSPQKNGKGIEACRFGIDEIPVTSLG